MMMMMMMMMMMIERPHSGRSDAVKASCKVKKSVGD